MMVWTPGGVHRRWRQTQGFAQCFSHFWSTSSRFHISISGRTLLRLWALECRRPTANAFINGDNGDRTTPHSLQPNSLKPGIVGFFWFFRRQDLKSAFQETIAVVTSQ